MSARPAARLAGLGLVLGLVACEPAPPPAAEPASTGAASETASDTATAPAAALTAAMRRDPRAALDLLLAWDTAGVRYEPAYDAALQRFYCFLPAENCLSEEPGWDFVVAVRGYQLEPLYQAADSAAFQVLYDEIGMVWAEGMEEVEPAPPQVVRLARIGGEWRMVEPESQFPPHLSIDAIARRYRGVHPDSAVLVNWLLDRA